MLAVVRVELRVVSEKGYNVHMNNISIADILELPVQERICLVELIWGQRCRST